MSKLVKRSFLKQQLWKVDLARTSAEQVRAYCEWFISNKPDTASPLFSGLLTAICVVYAKPFTDNKSVGMLSDKFARYSSQDLRRLHKRLLHFRDNLYAHQNPEGRKLHIHVEEEDMGEHIRYTFSRQAESFQLNPARIPDVMQMCNELKPKLDSKYL